MLEILPIQEKSEQKRIAELCGAEYIEGDFAYSACVDGKLVGICQFNIKGDTSTLHTLQSPAGVDDEEALFIMARSALNFVNLCGVNTAYYAGEKCRLSIMTGFIEKNGVQTMNLKGFFEHPCSPK